MWISRPVLVALACLCLAGCDEVTPPLEDASSRDASTGGDAALPDAASSDAALPDSALPDAALSDAALPDAGLEADAAIEDSGTDSGTDAGLDAAVPACGDWTGPTPIRVLLVGNSQLQYHGFSEILTHLSRSAPAACPRIEAISFARGGATLGDLWRDGTAEGRLQDELRRGHHVVVLTESIDLADLPGFVTRFRADATLIIGAARAEGVVPMLYATPYVETVPQRGFREMADPQITLGAELGVTVAAGGLAWLKVWSVRPAADLYFSDRAHPGYRGSYLSALVVYAAITGASPVGLTDDADIACDGGRCPPIEADLVPIFQNAALEQHRETGR